MEMANQHLDILREMAKTRGILGRRSVFVCLDVEAWEQTGQEVLEIGIAHLFAEEVWFPTESQNLQETPDLWFPNSIHCQHIIVQEHQHLHNGHYVDDNRDQFRFGVSEVMTLQEATHSIQTFFASLASIADEIFLIGHTLTSDFKWLTEMGVDINFKTCDIAFVHLAQYPNLNTNFTGLQNMMKTEGLGYSHLHNAGNDCVYTLGIALRKMAEEDAARYNELGLLA
jgi:hypothetical protein